MGSRQVAPPMAQPVSSGYRQARSGRRREPRHGICAHRAPCATIGPRQRSIFSRAPFGFLSPAPASDGARERPRALHSGAFPGGRGSFLAPFRPAPPPQSAIIPVSLCQFRVDELTPAPSERGRLPSSSIFYAFGVSTHGQRWTARNFSRPPASPRIARLWTAWTAWTASLLN